MPTKMHFYLVRWVELDRGTFHEEEITQSAFEFMKNRLSAQILYAKYVRTKSLV